MKQKVLVVSEHDLGIPYILNVNETQLKQLSEDDTIIVLRYVSDSFQQLNDAGRWVKVKKGEYNFEG